MKAVWTKGCRTKAERDEKRKLLASAKPYFDLLSEQIKNKKKPEASRNYNSPNWAYEQIATNEYNQALQDVLDLLNIKE